MDVVHTSIPLSCRDIVEQTKRQTRNRRGMGMSRSHFLLCKIKLPVIRSQDRSHKYHCSHLREAPHILYVNAHTSTGIYNLLYMYFSMIVSTHTQKHKLRDMGHLIILWGLLPSAGNIGNNGSISRMAP